MRNPLNTLIQGRRYVKMKKNNQKKLISKKTIWFHIEKYDSFKYCKVIIIDGVLSPYIYIIDTNEFYLLSENYYNALYSKLIGDYEKLDPYDPNAFSDIKLEDLEEGDIEFVEQGSVH